MAAEASPSHKALPFNAIGCAGAPVLVVVITSTLAKADWLHGPHKGGPGPCAYRDSPRLREQTRLPVDVSPPPTEDALSFPVKK